MHCLARPPFVRCQHGSSSGSVARYGTVHARTLKPYALLLPTFLLSPPPAPRRSTDLFAKMAAAASMTEARIAQEDEGKAAGVASSTPRKSRNGTGAAAAAAAIVGNGKIKTGGRYPGGSAPEDRGSGREPGGEETSEFARMAQTLREQAEKNGAVSGRGTKAAAVTAAAMDVDSDEEETVTLEGEFKATQGGNDGGGAKLVAEEVGRVGGAAGRQKAGDGGGGEAEEEEEDLLSAVKKGKGRGRGKGKAKGKGKRGKA